MAFTYSGDPSSSVLDQVRYLIADTDADAFFLHDEEIGFEISQGRSPFFTASACALIIAAKLGRETEQRFEDIINKPQAAVSNYRILAQELRRRAINEGVGFGPPQAGGIRRSEVENVKSDTDRITPAFTRGQFSIFQYDRA